MTSTLLLRTYITSYTRRNITFGCSLSDLRVCLQFMVKQVIILKTMNIKKNPEDFNN